MGADGAIAQSNDDATLQALQKKIAILRAREELALLRSRVHSLESESSATPLRRQQETQLAKPNSAAALSSTVLDAQAADYPAKAIPYVATRSSSGFYIRGDLGGGYSSGYNFDVKSDGRSTNPLDTYNAQTRLAGTTAPDTALFANVGLGYRFTPVFRSDLTVSFLTHSFAAGSGSQVNTNGGLINGVGNLPTTTFTTPPVGNILSPALHAQSLVTMLNGYVDFAGFAPDRFGIVQPYISGGVGASVNKAQGAQLQMLLPFFNNDPVPVTFNDHTQTQLAWSLGAGVGFKVADNVVLDFAYKYMDLGDASAAGRSSTFMICAVNCPSFLNSNWTVKSRLTDHVLSVGFRVGL